MRRSLYSPCDSSLDCLPAYPIHRPKLPYRRISEHLKDLRKEVCLSRACDRKRFSFSSYATGSRHIPIRLAIGQKSFNVITNSPISDVSPTCIPIASILSFNSSISFSSLPFPLGIVEFSFKSNPTKLKFCRALSLFFLAYLVE